MSDKEEKEETSDLTADLINEVNDELEKEETSDLTEYEQNMVRDEIEDTEKRLKESGVLTADLINQVKKLVTAEMLTELKDNKVLKEKELEILREIEDVEHQKYVDTMMKSEEPWVEFIGNVRDTKLGQRLEMNWNPAFVEFLREIGIAGTDEDELVQKYITALLFDMEQRNKKDNEDKKGGEYA